MYGPAGSGPGEPVKSFWIANQRGCPKIASSRKIRFAEAVSPLLIILIMVLIFPSSQNKNAMEYMGVI